MNTKKLRLPLDVLMTLVSIVLMGGAYLFPADIVHEILGVALFVLWAVHIILNHRWYGNLFRGRYKTRRIIQTVLFLSGSGTPTPILDFKSLYALLEDDYRIVVIEKYGYGFSDIVDTERSFTTILRQDREALKKSGVEGPFILCPHSMSLSGYEKKLYRAIASRNTVNVDVIDKIFVLSDKSGE